MKTTTSSKKKREPELGQKTTRYGTYWRATLPGHPTQPNRTYGKVDEVAEADARAAFEEEKHQYWRRPQLHSPPKSRRGGEQQGRDFSKNPPLAELYDTYLAWVQQHRRAKTYRFACVAIRPFVAYLDKHYPNLRVADLKPFHVERFVEAKGWTNPNTIRNQCRPLKAALTWAVTKEYLDQSPLVNYRLPRAKPKDRYFTPGEWDRYRPFFARRTEYLDLVDLCWHLGLRPQEVRHIEARHFFPEATGGARLLFPASEAKGEHRVRVVYIPAGDPSLAILTRLVALYPVGKLLRNTRGQPWSMEGMSRLMDRFKKVHGFRFGYMSLRHSFCQRALLSGIDSADVARLMGHADVTMVARVYSHLGGHKEHLMGVAARLSAAAVGAASSSAAEVAHAHTSGPPGDAAHPRPVTGH